MSEEMDKLSSIIQSPQNTTTSETRYCSCGAELFTIGEDARGVCDKCANKTKVAPKINIDKELSSKGVPKRHLGCSFQNFRCFGDQELSDAVDHCSVVTSKFNDSLFLSSPRPGTGKTHLAVAILREVLLTGFQDVLFVSSPFLFLEIKDTFNSKDEANTEKKVIQKYSSVPFLVVDDIGVEKVSEWANQIWYMIIDSRYSKMLPTVYTSNLSVGQIAEKIDPRIASRLSSGIVINLKCEDYRKIKNSK